MIPNTSRVRHAVLFFIFALIPAVGFSAEAIDLGQPAGSVMVPAGFSRAQVQTIVEKALLGRQWEVKSKADDKVVGYIKHRGNEATLTLVISDKQVDLFCVGWQINKKTGVHEKPEQPTGWLKYIRGDMAKLLAKAPATK